MRSKFLFFALNTAILLSACESETINTPLEPDKLPPKVEDKTCSNECSGNSTCHNDTTLKLCRDEDGDGCKEWFVEVCPDQTTCQNGECVKKIDENACTDECDENACADELTLNTCRDTNGDGCKEWVQEKCPDNTQCSDDKCVPVTPTCTNECDGKPICDGDSGYKTCQDSDGDGCTEWSDVIPCADGRTCSDGICINTAPTCTDACSRDTKQCDGSNAQICKDTNGDGCTEWTSTACTTGLKCKSGDCVCKYTSVTDPGLHPLPGQNTAGKSEATTVNGYNDEYLYDASNKIKIGARKNWGGSIIFFGEAGSGPGTNGTNTIDGNDTGREVQVAIYDASRVHQGCAYNASCASNGGSCPNSITYLGWNPVQGGNRCNIGSNVDSVQNKDGILEIVTTPLHWNPNWDSSSCTSDGCSTSLKNRKSDVQLTQRLRFVDTLVVELFYTVVNLGSLDHTATVQELPTLYATYGAHGFGNYNTLLTASKQKISIDIPANDGFFHKPFKSSEPWVTLQNANLDYGVGILYENGLLDYTGWQKAGIFNNVRSNIKFGLPPNGVVNARAYLLLGSYDTIAANAAKLQKTLAPFGILDVPAQNATVSSTADISGWALDNRKVTKVIARIDDEKDTELTYGSDRPDVCKVWVGYPQCNKVGFSGKVSFAGLSNACAHKLEIIATDSDGNTRTIARRLVNVK